MLISPHLTGSIAAFLVTLLVSAASSLAQGTDDDGKAAQTPAEMRLPSLTANPFNIPQLELPPTAAYSAYQRGYYLTAFDLAIKLAGLGETSAQTLLGELYRQGQGIPRDTKEAANWFSLAADNGDREAQFALGLLYAQGEGVEKDLEKAKALFEQAANNGQKDAQLNLAMIYMQGQIARQDLTRALDLLTKSAKQGLPDAQYALANLYRSELFPNPNMDQAAYWMREAATGGFADAQLEYGLMLFKGDGVTQDYAAARGWIEQAANKGHIIAQNRLARILARGFGAPPQPIDAAYYYLLSSKTGKRDEWLEDFFLKLPALDKEEALRKARASSLW